MVTVIKKGASKKEISSLLKKHIINERKGIDLKKYCGILTIKDDPLTLQKKWRDEWE